MTGILTTTEKILDLYVLLIEYTPNIFVNNFGSIWALPTNHTFSRYFYKLSFKCWDRYSDTHGSLFSWEPNMIIDLRAFQSCRTLSRASWAKRGGSRSWSGISESEVKQNKNHCVVRIKNKNKDEKLRRITEAATFTFCISSLAISVFSDSWWSVLTVFNTLPGNSLN